MNVQEAAQTFARALLNHDFETAGQALAVLVAEPNGPAQVAQMLGHLLSGMQKGSLRRALQWVLTLPASSVVRIDVQAGLARVEADQQLEQEN